MITTRRHAAALFGCLSVAMASAWATPLEIAGSTTVQKSIVEPVSAKARDAGMALKMLPVGTGKGLAMLFDGKVTVAAISDELPEALKAAVKSGAANAPANLKVFVASTDKVTTIVHPDNKVPSLSREQLKAIFSGKVGNWKEVGGADLPITLVVPATGSGTRGLIENKILAGTAFATAAKELRTSSAELAEVARDKGAIGYVGGGVAESAKGKVREVSGGELTRPLAFVTVGEPGAEVKKLYDFLKSVDAKKLFLE